MCYSVVEVVDEHAVVELLVESRSGDYLVEIPVVDVVLFVVAGILLLNVVGEKVVVDPIPNLLRWDDAVEAIVDGDVVVAVLVVLVSFLSSVAVVFVAVVALLCLADADEKLLSCRCRLCCGSCRPRSDASPFLCCDSCS